MNFTIKNCQFNVLVVNVNIFQGKVKGKKLQATLSSIKESDLGPFAGGEFTSKGKIVKLQNFPLSSLKVKTNPIQSKLLRRLISIE